LLTDIKNKIQSSPLFEQINNRNGLGIFITGLRGSLNSFIVSYLSGINPNIIFCSTDKNRLFKLKDDVNLISGYEICSIYLGEYDEEFESDVSTLSTSLKKLGGDSGEPFILLTDPESLNKPIVSEETFKKNIISIKKNEELEFEYLISRFRDFGFEKKRMVEDENEFSVRGGIIDVYPENLNQPVRIEFFGNTVESIREFDIVTQRSISKLNEADILPSFQTLEALKEEDETLIKYLKSGSLIIIDEPDLVNHKSEKIFSSLIKLDCSFISSFPFVKCESLNEDYKKHLQEISFETKSQPSFSSNIKLFYENLIELDMFGYEIFITCSDDYQAKRTRELIEDSDSLSPAYAGSPARSEGGSAGRLTLPKVEGPINLNHFEKIRYLDNSIHAGFILPEQKIAVYTEHEVFGRYFRPTKRKRRFGGITFKELGKINYGDFMVHRDFGIGKYAGLKKVTTGGVQQETVKLLYRDNDVVFVNLNSLDLVKKFSAQEGVTPKLNKLGGNEWERIKQRTKRKIQDIAKDLILLYAKRKSLPGFKFSADSVWQKELEASFIYEDTPDQISATEAVKLDMESPHPMDRLICGDVGFGKTEVAVRAAFKAVLDNKQAAVLVPTTILAEQHYNTFKDRLSNWAVEVEHLSRFKTKKEQKLILEKLADGMMNIIIGTHRLLSKDVKFKNLGLLVIDEEQRFGVKAKEQLKFMRESIDVLTLTATPIPRTLNFSLLGARDLSIINTPPKNRQPIHTEIVNFDKKIISNAIIRELQRGGQVYFVNDQIAKLEELADIIEETVPFAKVAIAHGQMSSPQLENVMMKFLEKKTNVLLCTKIIESGLDIPSVNTIIINRAENFGLAELYQLRGRVGRSNIKSFAYLITPPQSVLTRQAIRRLHALEEFTELGSGMNLALKDLEIRGAGNLLGGEQSGFIAEIGFDMYMQILDDAITELKESELGEVIADIMPRQKEKPKKKIDMVIESDISMLIPESYIDDENTRLEIYQRLAAANSFDEIKTVEEEMNDRFGTLPEDVISLMKHIEMKLMLGEKGFEKISIQGDIFELFVDLKNEEFFNTGYFDKVVNYINTPSSSPFEGGDRTKLNQSKKTLSIQYKIFYTENPEKKLEEVYEFAKKLVE